MSDQLFPVKGVSSFGPRCRHSRSRPRPSAYGLQPARDQAHAAVAALDLREGGVVAARKQARAAARDHIREIDEIAQRLLGLPASETVTAVIAETDGEEESDEDPDSSGT